MIYNSNTCAAQTDFPWARRKGRELPPRPSQQPPAEALLGPGHLDTTGCVPTSTRHQPPARQPGTAGISRSRQRRKDFLLQSMITKFQPGENLPSSAGSPRCTPHTHRALADWPRAARTRERPPCRHLALHVQRRLWGQVKATIRVRLKSVVFPSRSLILGRIATDNKKYSG